MTPSAAALLIALTLAQAAASLPAPATTARISGRVTAEGSSAPVAGARVILIPSRPRMGTFTPPGEAITDEDGRFAFEGIVAGSYNVDVQKAGYVAFPDTQGRPHTIDVAAGQTLANMEVHLQKGGIIAGRLLDAAGQPIPEVSVMAMRRVAIGGQDRYLPTSGSGPGQTNDIGEFRVAGLAPGDYIVAASPRGQSPFGARGMSAPAAATTAPRTVAITTYYPGTRDQATAQTIHVAAQQTVENIVFTVLSAPAYRVSGMVVDEAGAAVGGAVVSLMNDPRAGVFTGPPAGGRSRDDGTFVITGVPAGSYRATAMVPVTITTTSSGSGGGGFTTWTSTSGSAGVSGGIVGGTTGAIISGGSGGMVSGTTTGMAATTDVVVADADVSGVRLVVKR